MQTSHDSWNPPTSTGTATTWSPLAPTKATGRMQVETKLGASGEIVVFASLGRSQHFRAETNTEYRIVVDSTEIATTNTGGATDWNYSQVSFFGMAQLTPNKLVMVEVEYKTQQGTVVWYNDTNGSQQRKLLALTW